MTKTNLKVGNFIIDNKNDLWHIDTIDIDQYANVVGYYCSDSDGLERFITQNQIVAVSSSIAVK